ncbi:MAG: hypothetical protein ACOYJQ_17940 [Pseudochelatococcus sp.]|uniref:hypothetical protein n=1 Tax=Pseudochelatococcus sp. TaxID=2020869 RepID=UPI003D8EFF1D
MTIGHSPRPDGGAQRGEIFYGAAEIALALYGSAEKHVLRRIYNQAKAKNIPAFKIGGRWCAPKQDLEDFIRNKMKE